MQTFKSNNNQKSGPASNSAQKVNASTIQTKLNIGKPNDAYEQEADRVADQVVKGADNHTGETMHTPANQIQAKPLLNAPKNQIQRYVFLGGQQLDKTVKQPNATMQTWTGDSKIRDYKTKTEFENHAAGNTDYIGNLDIAASQDTWVRFSDSGLNVIGENHALVPMEYVMPAVGSKKFTYEAFSNDDFNNLPVTGAIYDQESKIWQQKMGIDTEPNHKQFGGESIFPKVAYALDNFLQFLEPQYISEFQSGTHPDGSPKYAGQPFQRYFKLGWAWSNDIRANIISDPLSVTPGKLALDKAHKDVASDIDPFFNSLTPEGFLGDELGKPANAHLYGPLKKFAGPLLNAMYEMLATDPDSPLPIDEQKKLDPSSGISMDEKGVIIAELRDLNILNAVNAASDAGMRYSGMGLDHLKYIQRNNHMKSNWNPYDLAEVDLKKFEKRTSDLKAKAK